MLEQNDDNYIQVKVISSVNTEVEFGAMPVYPPTSSGYAPQEVYVTQEIYATPQEVYVTQEVFGTPQEEYVTEEVFVIEEVNVA